MVGAVHILRNRGEGGSPDTPKMHYVVYEHCSLNSPLPRPWLSLPWYIVTLILIIMITECAPPWIESTLGCLVFLHTEVKMISTIEPAADHVFTMIMIMIVALLMYFSRLTLGRELKQFATILADSWLRQGWSNIWIFPGTVCFQRATFESLASLEALVSTAAAAATF